MTELKEFLFDFDFDDIQLMEEIDQAVNEKEISNEDDVQAESEPEAPTFSEEDLLAARQEGFAAGKEEGVEEAHRRFARLEPGRVEKTDHSCKRRSRC